jgi:uncharacterized membrane protein
MSLKPAILSGTSAALASVFGKLAMDDEFVDHVVRGSNLFDARLEANAVLATRALCFAMIFASNAIMMSLFAKSMDLVGSVAATVTNSATNFTLSGLLACVIFGESLSLRWWLGSLSILVGIVLINNGQRAAVDKKTE